MRRPEDLARDLIRAAAVASDPRPLLEAAQALLAQSTPPAARREVRA